MPIEIRQIIALLLVMVVIGTIVFTITNGIFWVFLRIYRWLYKHSWFSRRVIQAKTAIRNFWNKYLPNLTNLWEFFSDTLLDPLFYGYFLVVLVNRLESINQSSKQFPEYNFYALLERDMNTDTNFYTAFFIVFTIWMYGRAWKHSQDIKEKRAMRKLYEANTKVLEAIANKLNIPESEYKSVNDEGNKKQGDTR